MLVVISNGRFGIRFHAIKFKFKSLHISLRAYHGNGNRQHQNKWKQIVLVHNYAENCSSRFDCFYFLFGETKDEKILSAWKAKEKLKISDRIRCVFSSATLANDGRINIILNSRSKWLLSFNSRLTRNWFTIILNNQKIVKAIWLEWDSVRVKKKEKSIRRLIHVGEKGGRKHIHTTRSRSRLWSWSLLQKAEKVV